MIAITEREWLTVRRGARFLVTERRVCIAGFEVRSFMLGFVNGSGREGILRKEDGNMRARQRKEL